MTIERQKPYSKRSEREMEEDFDILYEEYCERHGGNNLHGRECDRC